MAERPLRLTLDATAQKAWRFLVVVVAGWLVVLALARLRIVVLPVIIALLLATALVPPVEALVRRGLPRLLATWLVLLGSIGVLVAVVFLLAPSVNDEFEDLGPTLSEGRRDIEEWLADGPLELDRDEIQRYIDDAQDQLSGRGGEVVEGVVAGATLVGEVIAGFLLTIVLVFFAVKDSGKFTGFALRAVPARHHDLARAVGNRAWTTAGGYLKGTAVVGLVDASIIGIGLVIIGVPLVLPLAVLTFFGAFFPLVGATVAGAIAAVVALVDGGVGTALLVVGLVVIVQQVEGDVLAPLVLGRAVRLHPVVILVALTAGAVIGGLAGAFLAVPVTAVAVAIGSELGARGIIGPDDVQPPSATARPD